MVLDYLLIDALIIIFPLLLSFKWKFQYIRFLKPLLASISIVGTGYIIWDMLVTYRGDWSFNKDYLSGIEIVNLPLEEILFFVTVPYACIFIFENLMYFIKDKEIWYNRNFYLGLSVVFFFIGIIFYHQEYTILAMLSVSFFFLISALFFEEVLKSRLFWAYLFLSFIPFLIFNYLLTSIPIVTYNSAAIWNIRITTIPLEDFFYNFSMLSFYLLVYRYFRTRWGFDEPK